MERVEIRAKVVRHDHYVTFQMAEERCVDPDRVGEAIAAAAWRNLDLI